MESMAVCFQVMTHNFLSVGFEGAFSYSVFFWGLFLVYGASL